MLLAGLAPGAVGVSAVDETVVVIVLPVSTGFALTFGAACVTTVGAGGVLAAVAISAVNLAITVVVDTVVANLRLGRVAGVVCAALAVGAVNFTVAVVVDTVGTGLKRSRIDGSIVVVTVNASAAVRLGKVTVAVRIRARGAAADVRAEVTGISTGIKVTFAVSGERATTTGVNMAESAAIAGAAGVVDAIHHPPASVDDGNSGNRKNACD